MLQYKKEIIIIFLIIVSVFIIFLFKNDNFELYAIKYGDSFYYSGNIYHYDNFEKPLPFVWSFYLIKYKDKNILIDTGYKDEKYTESFNINYKNPIDLLERIKINPDNITDIILTHSHFDHIGNIDKFKYANIYIQEKELKDFLRKSKDVEIIDFLSNNKNIFSFKEKYKLYDFIEIEKIGGHTIGSSVVYFRNRDKNYIVTGDECYFIDNCMGKPIGTYYNIDKNIEFIEGIESLENIIILPFHDVLIFEKYKEIKENIYKII